MQNINVTIVGISLLIIILIIVALKFLNRYRNVPAQTQTESFNPQNKYKGDLILYHTTWCGYSKQFKPIWDEFVSWSKKNNMHPAVNFSDVVCEGGNETVCNQKGIEGYPTIILTVNGADIPFSGERTSNGLDAFLRSNNL